MKTIIKILTTTEARVLMLCLNCFALAFFQLSGASFYWQIPSFILIFYYIAALTD